MSLAWVRYELWPTIYTPTGRVRKDYRRGRVHKPDGNAHWHYVTKVWPAPIGTGGGSQDHTMT